jgi:hypothetical protein
MVMGKALRTVVLVAGLAGLVSWSAREANAMRIARPSAKAIRLGGKLFLDREIESWGPDYWIGPRPLPPIKPRPPIEIEPPIARPPIARPPIRRFIFVWKLQVGDRVYRLNVAGSPELLRRANELSGKFVVLHGVMQGGTLHVRHLAADPMTVELTGTLHGLIGIQDCALPPCSVPSNIWRLRVGGEAHTLTFVSPELESKAFGLIGKPASVVARRQGGTLLVTHIAAAR